MNHLDFCDGDHGGFHCHDNVYDLLCDLAGSSDVVDWLCDRVDENPHAADDLPTPMPPMVRAAAHDRHRSDL